MERTACASHIARSPPNARANYWLVTATGFATLAGRVALVGLAVGAFVWALDPSYRDIIAGISIVLLAAAVVAMPRSDVGDSSAGGVSVRVGPALVVCALGTLASLRGWFVGGTPAFAHDWKWPLVASQMHAWPSILHSAWLSWGSGAPAVQELASYPIVMTASALGTFLSPAVTLYVVLTLLGIAGGLGAARVAAAAGLDMTWQILFAAAFPLLPPAFDRLCAGHFNWLLGYALFPHFAATLLTYRPSPMRAGALGVFWGLAASQVEFLTFFAVALAVAGRRAVRWDAIGAAALACGIQAPMIAALFASHPSAAFESAHTNLAWQLAQSSGVLIGLAGGADPVHYFELAEPLAAFFLAPLVLAAAYGALSAPQFRGLAVLWLVASAWAAGLHGPFASIAGPLFQNVSAAAILREFSHAEVVVALPLLLFAAIGVRALLPGRAGVAAVVFAALLAPGVAPMLEGKLATIDAPMRVPASYESVSAFLASLPGDGQILWLPEIQPLAFAHSRGGADSLAFPAGRHNPYLEYRPTVEIVAALRALDWGRSQACGLLGDLGVQAVVVRPSVTSNVTWPNFSQTPARATLRADGLSEALRTDDVSVYAVPCYRGIVTWGTPATLRGDWYDLANLSAAGATDEVTLPPSPPAYAAAHLGQAPRTSYSSLDPSDGWVPLSALDDYLPWFGYAFGDVVLTLDASADDVSGYLLAAIPGSHFRWQSADAIEQRLRSGPVAIWEVAKPTNQMGAPGIPGPSKPLRLRVDSNSYSGPAPDASSLVVLHQRNYGAWRAVADGQVLRPLPADGFAVGWIVGPNARNLSIYYAAPPMWILWTVAVASLLVGSALAVGQPRRRPSQAGGQPPSKYGHEMVKPKK